MEIDFKKLELLARGDEGTFTKEIQTMWANEIAKETRGLPDVRIRDYTNGFNLAREWFLIYIEHYHHSHEEELARWKDLAANLIKHR